MDSRRSVPFLAPVIESLQRAVAEVVLGGIMVTDVPCPACGTVCALWLRRRLYRPDGTLGRPLCADDRDNVALPCPCGQVWHSSGRGVGYRLRKGLPPLA